ncbi:MAG: hypothetical protein Q8L51_02370 [Candidatus Amesbacteria bacterium]|nr:hypothetical protein [Candidatus Amesbacteria bacterium]
MSDEREKIPDGTYCCKRNPKTNIHFTSNSNLYDSADKALGIKANCHLKADQECPGDCKLNKLIDVLNRNALFRQRRDR